MKRLLRLALGLAFLGSSMSGRLSQEAEAHQFKFDELGNTSHAILNPLKGVKVNQQLTASWAEPLVVTTIDARTLRLSGNVAFSGPGLYCDITSTEALFHRDTSRITFPEGAKISACVLRDPGPPSTSGVFINHFDCLGPAETFGNGMLKSCQNFSNVRVFHNHAERSVDALYFYVECFVFPDADDPFSSGYWFKSGDRVSFYEQGIVHETYLVDIFDSPLGSSSAYGCYKYLRSNGLRTGIHGGRNWEFLESGDLM